MFMRAVDHAVAAVLCGDDDRLGTLLDADATLGLQRTMFGVSPLLAARAVGREDLVGRLRPPGPLPLVLAAELGDFDAVRAVLDADPAAVASRDASGSTALRGAAYCGRVDVVELLLAAGADPRATTADDVLRIPVLGSAIATTPGVPQPSDEEDVVLRLVRSLLEHGADPNDVRRDGMTALHSAAWRGLGRVVQELLDAGAERSARATDGPHAGQTPADRSERSTSGRSVPGRSVPARSVPGRSASCRPNVPPPVVCGGSPPQAGSPCGPGWVRRNPCRSAAAVSPPSGRNGLGACADLPMARARSCGPVRKSLGGVRSPRGVNAASKSSGCLPSTPATRAPCWCGPAPNARRSGPSERSESWPCSGRRPCSGE
jgi:hypothetical protein